MDRKTMLATIDAIFAGRISRDLKAMAEHLADGATFRFAGENTMMEAFSVSGAAPFMEAVAVLDGEIFIHKVENLTTVIEGNRVAAMWNYGAQFGDRPPITTEIFNLWTFDDDGKVTDLTEFVDTAKLASETAALGG